MNNNWMDSILGTTSGGRFLTPNSGINYYEKVWNIYSDHHMGYKNACYAFGIIPTFYLNSDVSIIDGIGTEDKPYIIG